LVGLGLAATRALRIVEGMKRALLALVMAACGGDDTGTPADASGTDAARADANVDGGPGETTTITFAIRSLDGATETDDVVLVSDNGGAWRPMTLDGEVFTAEVVGPRYAVARGCSEPLFAFAEAWIYFLTIEDGTALTDVGCHDSPTVRTVSGTLTGVAGNQRGTVYAEHGAGFFGAGATAYQLTTGSGTTDLVARLNASSQPRVTQRLLIVRDLDVTVDTVRDLDFVTEGFDPVEHQFTVTGIEEGDVETVSVALLSNVPGGFDKGIESFNGGPTDRYHAPPAERLEAGERLIVTRGASGIGTTRQVSVVIDTPADLTAVLGPAYAAPEPNVIATTPSVRLAGTLPLVAGGDLYQTDAIFFDDVTFDSIYWTQFYTARWAEGSTEIAFAHPELAGIGGWDIALPEGVISWNASVKTSALEALSPLPTAPNPPVGDVITRSVVSGEVNAF
jgi:hypothetical protein